MSTTLDYAGRKADLVAFDNIPQGGGEALAIPRLASPGEGGKIIAGIARLTQSIFLKLLTIRGSMPYLLDEGTDFIAKFRQNTIRTQLEAEQAFQSAVVDIKRQLGAAYTDEPDDERLADIQILSVLYLPDSVVFRFEVTSVAGSKQKLLLPLSTRLTAGAM